MRSIGIFKEPLVQFLVLGGLLFLAYSTFAPPKEPPRERIVIDQAVIGSLQAAFQAAWKRPPTPAERQGLIDDYLAEELLYREAQKLELDRNDVVIRRRMRQKMQFLLQDSLAAQPLDETELRAFFEENRARYQTADRLTFSQVFLGAEASDAEIVKWRALAENHRSATPASLEAVAQPSLLPERLEMAEPEAIARVFGRAFSQDVLDARTERWSGPLESSYGWHLVRLEDRLPGGAPAFDEVRAQVARDMMYEKRKEAEKALIDRLKRKYEIILEEKSP